MQCNAVNLIYEPNTQQQPCATAHCATDTCINAATRARDPHPVCSELRCDSVHTRSRNMGALFSIFCARNARAILQSGNAVVRSMQSCSKLRVWCVSMCQLTCFSRLCRCCFASRRRVVPHSTRLDTVDFDTGNRSVQSAPGTS